MPSLLDLAAMKAYALGRWSKWKDYVDLYYLHNPPDDPDVMHRVLEEFLKLKEEGKIRAIGASIKGPDVTTQTVALCRQYIETGHVDAIQLIYSIFRQKTAEVFKQAYHSGVGIVARTVLENGFLTGKYKPGDSFSDNDHRRRWGNAKIYKILEASHHVQSIAIQSPYETITQTAIAFSLASKYVTTAIVGAKTEDQVIKNVALAKLPPLDKSIISRLQHEYDGKTEMFNIGENNNTH
jgi:aryl-alcohol dehydrogenase-like predicted oxidoreductase